MVKFPRKTDEKSKREPKEHVRESIDLEDEEIILVGQKPKTEKSYKALKILIPLLIIVIIGSAGTYIYLRYFVKKADIGPIHIDREKIEHFYDALTGEEISYSGTQYDSEGRELVDENGKTIVYSSIDAQKQANILNRQRIYCIQIPNGLDDARPQVGLDQAKIVFEAIAEAGITRFAALYQGMNNSAIGPIRSLRNYYYDWDVPFDCTIVHAGGEDEARERAAEYGKHLDESTTYMWRSYGHWVGANYVGYYAPNNLFTDGSLLDRFTIENGRDNDDSSQPKVWLRMTPYDSEDERADRKEKQENLKNAQDAGDAEAVKKAQDEIAALPKSASSININFSVDGFNVHYDYDTKNNRYMRSYTNIGPHTSYICPANLSQPKPQEECGDPVQLSTNVVIVMKVEEHLSEVNHYREVITTSGSGEATIFQNGYVIEGTWEKEKVEEQIVFKDKKGQVIKLAPGKTWVSVIPKQKSVTYE